MCPCISILSFAEFNTWICIHITFMSPCPYAIVDLIYVLPRYKFKGSSIKDGLSTNNHIIFILEFNTKH